MSVAIIKFSFKIIDANYSNNKNEDTTDYNCIDNPWYSNAERIYRDFEALISGDKPQRPQNFHQSENLYSIQIRTRDGI